ncbi:MAG TPA: hypothetical protein VG779_09590 [Actinomycetota bacterium]|nr:hypothetical protein [Actinomycetota bacterium]
MIIPRWQRAALVPALAATWLLAGCGKSPSPSTAATTPATAPGATAPSAAGSGSIPATSALSGSTAEQQDLAQAQKDIADLEKALGQVDSGLNANQQTEGDVNP